MDYSKYFRNYTKSINEILDNVDSNLIEKSVKIINKIIKQNKKKFIPTNEIIRENEDLIIENNDNFVVINKPAGIPVQSGTKSFKNIIDILKNTEYFNNSKPYIVHRLDKETSGVMLIAKNREYAQLFTSLFRIRKIHKIYIFISSSDPDRSYFVYNIFVLLVSSSNLRLALYSLF